MMMQQQQKAMDSEELSDYPENGLVNDMQYDGEDGLNDTSQLSNT